MVAKTSALLKKPRWYKMTSLFSEPAKRVSAVGDNDVLLKGMVYQAGLSERIESVIEWLKIKTKNKPEAKVSAAEMIKKLKAGLGEPELALCVVPPAISQQQGEALRMMLTANLRVPVVLLTDNVHLVQLKPISEAQAKAAFDDGAPNDKESKKGNGQGKVVPFAKPSGEASKADG